MLAPMWETLQRMWVGLLAALPRIAVAALCFVVGIGVAVLVRRAVRRLAQRRAGEHGLSLALGRLAFGGILIVGLLVAAVVAFPGFKPADLVRILGIGGVAIGFAFKDIFQNFLAGILLLATHPFRVGDQIIVDDFEGTVQDIQTRATFIKTYDGRMVVIPNADLYTKPVTVNTTFETRRSEYDVPINFTDDLERVRHLVIDAMVEAEGVLPDPKADCIVVSFDDGGVALRARWWGRSRIADQLLARDAVLTRIKERLDAEGIAFSLPVRQLVFDETSPLPLRDGRGGDGREGGEHVVRR